MTKENARNDRKVLGRPCDLTLFWLHQNVPLLAKERDVAKRQGEVAIPSPCEGKGPEGEVKVPVAAWGYDAEAFIQFLAIASKSLLQFVHAIAAEFFK